MVSGKNKNVEKCPDISGMLSVFAGIATLNVTKDIVSSEGNVVDKLTTSMVDMRNTFNTHSHTGNLGAPTSPSPTPM